jgi:hypothetical protein
VKCNPIAENAELKIESFDDEELEEGDVLPNNTFPTNNIKHETYCHFSLIEIEIKRKMVN